MKISKLAGSALIAMIALSSAAISAKAENYVIDTAKAHASINFSIKHLGYSWLTGRFDRFSGTFSFDPKDPAKSKVAVEIDTSSVNSNHAPRDKHLRSADFLDVAKYPTARFVSTKVTMTGKDTALVEGKLTLHGVTRDIKINASRIGGGKDPWGGYRQGFMGTVSLALADYAVKKNLGPASANVNLVLHIEGIRQ